MRTTLSSFTVGWMDKESVVSIYNGILFNPQKEGNSVICDNIGAPWRYRKLL